MAKVTLAKHLTPCGLSEPLWEKWELPLITFNSDKVIFWSALLIPVVTYSDPSSVSSAQENDVCYVFY